jgi:hypothetical protein
MQLILRLDALTRTEQLLVIYFSSCRARTTAPAAKNCWPSCHDLCPGPDSNCSSIRNAEA